MEGRPSLRRWDGARVENPQDDERRTGRVEPVATLGARACVLGGPRNPMRDGRSRRKVVEALTRSLTTLEDRGGPADQLLH
jgi:hypothetical protein